jgi:hypothetical protein
MKIIKWFLWRRWLFRHWLKSMTVSDALMHNCHKCNIAGCAEQPLIRKDMVRIIKNACTT